MKKAVMLVLILALVGIMSPDGFAKEQALKPFNVGYLASPGHVMYFVAKEKGFFQEEGLDVTLFLFTNSGEGMNAIQFKKLDVGTFGTTAPLKFISNGGEFTLFGGQMNGGSGLVTLPARAEEFKDLKNYRGKKIATVRLSTVDVVFRAALMDAGVDWKTDLTLFEMDSPAAVLEAVKKGTADAGMVWAPFMKNCEKQGMVVAKYSDEVEPMHSCCRQAALTSALKEHPEDYVKFTRALIKAYRFYQTNHEETVDMIGKYVKVDRDVLMAETYGGHVLSSPDPGPRGTLKFWQNMKKVGYATSDINIEDHIQVVIYKTALDSILKEYPNDKVYLDLRDQFQKN